MSELTLNESAIHTPTKRALVPEDLTQLSFELARHVDEKPLIFKPEEEDDDIDIPFVDLSAAMNYAPVHTETPFESRSRYRSIPIDQHNDTQAVLPMDALSIMKRTLSQIFFCF
jgi:hypothetical protein